MNRKRFDEIFDSLCIEQDRKEFFSLVNEVETLNPRTIIEVGVKEGGSLRFWEQIVPPKGLVIGVDNHPDTPKFIKWDWRGSNRRVILIIGDSAAPSTVERARKALSGRLADFLFIDGFHYEEYPKKDFDNYSPFVRDGGLVCFADLGGWMEDGLWIGGEPSVRDAYSTLPHGRKEVRWRYGTTDFGMGLWWKPLTLDV